MILAANAILMKVVMTASYFIDGIAFATETMVGEAAGANDTDTCETVLNTASRWEASRVLPSPEWSYSPAWTLGLLSDQPEVLVTAASMRGWLIAVRASGDWHTFAMASSSVWPTVVRCGRRWRYRVSWAFCLGSGSAT